METPEFVSFLQQRIPNNKSTFLFKNFPAAFSPTLNLRTAGSVLGGFGPVGTGDGELSFPAGIALDSQGSVYVMDSESASARLMKIELKPPFAP